MNTAKKVLVVGGLLLLALWGRLYWMRNTAKDGEGRNPPRFSVEVTSVDVRVVLHQAGVQLSLPPGWRAFTRGTSLADDLKDSEPFADPLAGIPWFLHTDLGITPEMHVTLLSPDRWAQLTETTTDNLREFGYLNQPPRFLDLLREFDIVVLQKQRGQTLDQFVAEADQRVLRDAEAAAARGDALPSVVEDARNGFFGSLAEREKKKVANGGVESLVLSKHTTPPFPDTELFLFLSCPSGSHVAVINLGPYHTDNLDGYINHLHMMRDRAIFTPEFCR